MPEAGAGYVVEGDPGRAGYAYQEAIKGGAVPPAGPAGTTGDGTTTTTTTSGTPTGGAGAGGGTGSTASPD